MERAGCRWVHLDIMDNHFVPNLTFGPPVVAALRKASRKLIFDTHLMVEDPASLIDAFAAAGSQVLTVHSESCGAGLAAILGRIRDLGIMAGVSVKPGTRIAEIEPVLHLADLVLVMTVEPGFGGQSLIPSCLTKVRKLKRIRAQRNLRYLIEVDGGVNLATAELCVAAGAEVLVAGSAVFAGGTVRENVEHLMRAIGG